MDRLSELPESILLHILSFLPMNDVVKTAILSKRWRHLWTILQDLDFDSNSFWPVENFVDFVNRTLLCRSISKIKKLRIRIFLLAFSRKEYDGWIFYAAKNNVEELFLDFDSDGFCYWLAPQCVYCNSSLRTLRLWSCRIIPAVQICWNSLTKLTLRFSILWDEVVHKIMMGAPKLEFFELNSCWGYHDLNFDSPSLRTVIVHEEESLEFELGPILSISAPKVQSLHLSGTLERKCVLMNVSSVVRATLNFDCRNKSLKWQQRNLMEIVRSLKHVESLTFGPWCVEVLALQGKRRIPSHISAHKCVTLRTYMKKDDLLGTLYLLKGSPALQILIIDMGSDFYKQFPKGTELAESENFCNTYGSKYLASQAKHVGCLNHLKTVKITQFVAQCCVFPFLEFILKNGRVLENLVIVAKKVNTNTPESLLKVAQRLLSLPRASSQAVVTLLN